MKKIGLNRCMESGVDDFVTDAGIKFRKSIATPYRMFLETQTKGKIIVEYAHHDWWNINKSSILDSTNRHVKIEKNKPYIYVSTHYFSEDIITPLSKIDQGLYTLMGSTNQIETNPLMYAAWLRGIVYVDRLDPKSRNESFEKMVKLLTEYNISVLLYPEGGWNNTENLLCAEFFNGPYKLAKATGFEVVPISQFYKEEAEENYIMFGDPIDLSKYDKNEAKTLLRDTMATMMYNLIERHSVPFSRGDFEGDLHFGFMEDRKLEYAKQKWTRDTWDEELTRYRDKSNPLPKEVRDSLRGINFNSQNAEFFAPLLREMGIDERYDFNRYMHDTFEYHQKSKVLSKKKNY